MIKGIIGGYQQHQPPANLERGDLFVLQQDPLPQPRASLLEKFDGTHSKFQRFVNHICMIIILQSTRHPLEASRVILIGTLLT